MLSKNTLRRVFPADGFVAAKASIARKIIADHVHAPEFHLVKMLRDRVN
jgi:hypothetical protein